MFCLYSSIVIFKFTVSSEILFQPFLPSDAFFRSGSDFFTSILFIYRERYIDIMI